MTGFNTETSDIDLHIIFDNSDPNRIIRGAKVVNGKKIEYFEKPIDEEYLMAEYEFANQNSASLSIIGKGTIVFERDGSLTNLQNYVLDRYKDSLPPLGINQAREQISIIDNKIQKLENLINEDSPYFNHMYHIVLEKMRKTHHRIIGISQVPTSKVHILYTNEPYRKSTCKTNPSQDFVDDYLRLVTLDTEKEQMLEELKAFYKKIKNNIELGKQYRIPLERNNSQKSNPCVSSSEIARLDMKSKMTMTEVTKACQTLQQLKDKEEKEKGVLYE